MLTPQSCNNKTCLFVRACLTPFCPGGDGDAGETDWKVIVIDREDRWASELNDVEDVERLLPGVVSAIREWFRT